MSTRGSSPESNALRAARRKALRQSQGGGGRSEALLRRFHEEEKVESYDLKNLKRIWPFVAPHKKLLFGSFALLFLASFVSVAGPLVMSHGLDAAKTDPHAITRAGIVVTVLMVLEQAIAFPQMYLMQKAGARAMADMRRAVFRFLHTRSLAFFDRQPVGRLVTRVTNDVDAINEMFASGALNAFGDLVRLVLIVAILVGEDPLMSLITFAALPPVALGVNYTRRRIRDAFREVRSKTARMNAYLNEQVNGMAIVQAYAREEQGAEEFDAINDAYRNANNRSIVWDATLDAAIELVSSICIAAVLWAAGGAFMREHVSFGKLFLFVAYIDKFFLPIRDLSARYTLAQSAVTGAERVFELLDNKEEDAPGAGKVAKGRDTDVVLELDHVTFGYKPTVDVLHDVTLRIKQGEKVALVGATGAGKSTVASLFLRLYDVRGGVVRAFGEDVCDWDRDALRSHFAVVPQDVFLFPGTVASNVAAGDAEPDLDRVTRALTRIGALDVFTRRDEGLLAPVLERGANFSAGERQLIAFARALYRDPEIVVLDEATASVDSDTESKLQHAIEEMMAGRTSLVIAHRLSTIRAADRIIVFHKGRIVEEGSHDELLALDGVYARLHKLQFLKEVPPLGGAEAPPSPPDPASRASSP